MDLYGHLYEGVDEAAAQALDVLHRSALEVSKSRPEQSLRGVDEKPDQLGCI
jgi:hypothetical protein